MKKILSLLICLSLLCSFVTLSANAESSDASEAIETLAALGIFEGADNGDLMPEKALTRAEFVTMLMRALKADYGSARIYFDDVDESHWAASSIATACEMGLVKGVDERTFSPDAPVAFEEAVKMLVCALGYEPVAEKRGGYAMGYLNVAQNIGLLDGVLGTNGLIVRRNIAAKMFLNALDCEVVTEHGLGEEISMTTEKNVTLLSEKMKIEKGEGIVEANDVTSLSHVGGVASGQVKIGDRVFRAEETNAEALLGYAVTYYADNSDTDDIQELIYVRKNETVNTVTKVFSTDILPDTTTTDKLVYLTKDDKIKKVGISAYADLLYNGVSVGGFTKEDMVPSYGYIKLIDNDGDGDADVLSVFDFQTIVVGEKNATAFKAYDFKDGLKKVELDPSSDEYSFAVYENDKKTDFSAVKAGSTLLVAESKNTSGRKSKTVLVSNNTAVGALAAVASDNATVGDTEYALQNESLSTEMKQYLNRDITVYLDAFGKIAGIDKAAESSFQYGYLIACSKDGNFAPTRLKILETNNTVSVFDCAKKISLDGAAAQAAETVVTRLAATKRENGTGIEQVVRFRRNSLNEVTAIDTVGKDAGGEEDTLKKDVEAGTSRRHFFGAFGVAGAVSEVDFIVDDETVVFLLPKADEKNDDSKYNAAEQSYFEGASYYDLEGYDMKDGCLKVCVLQNTENYAVDISTGAMPAIIEDISVTVNVRGDETYKITARSGNKTVEKLTLDKDVLRERNSATGAYTGVVFQKGDIVRWATNSFDEIIKIESLLSDAKSDSSLGFSSVGTNENRFYASYAINYGYLTKKDGSKIVLDTVPGGGGTIRPFVISNVSCYVVNMKTGNVVLRTIDELNDCLNNAQRRVGVITKNAALYQIVIYQFD